MEQAQIAEMRRVIDGFWRRPAEACDPEVKFVEVPGGWLRLRPGAPPDAYASVAETRLSWAAAGEAPTTEMVGLARGIVSGEGVARTFAWLGTDLCTPEVEARLGACGLRRVAEVRYFALARALSGVVAQMPCAYEVRALGEAEALAALAHVAPWYSERGAERAARRVRAGLLRFHAALDERGTVVGLGGLLRNGPWAYLGWTGVDPAHHRRGVQSALIASRVRAAAEEGARWCASETNSAVMTSLRNLARAGFEVKTEWAVYQWDVGGAGGGA